MATAPIFIGTVKTAAVTFLPADASTVKDIYAAGATGGKIQILNAATDETAARIIRLHLRRAGAGADFLLGSVTIPIGAGIGAVASINLLTAVQFPFTLEDGSWLLGPSDVIRGNMETTITAAKTLWLAAAGGDY